MLKSIRTSRSLVASIAAAILAISAIAYAAPWSGALSLFGCDSPDAAGTASPKNPTAPEPAPGHFLTPRFATWEVQVTDSLTDVDFVGLE